ncbi:snRNA-activating protein complex subunit 1, partial [Danaus plexippus plexippus]
PYTNFAWLRLTPDDIPAIKRIELVARQDRRLDLLYILGEILIKYTQYHAVERERGMESVLRKYLDGYTSIDKLGVRPKGVFYRQNEELDIIRDLGTVSRQYTKAKDMLRVAGRPDPSLQYINENLPFELNVTLKKIINGAIDDDCDDSPDEHYNMVQAIKTRAVTNTVDNMRHLTAVEDRISTQENSSPRTSKQGKSDLKTPTGRVKSGSPTKRMTSSPGKRKLDVKSVRKKKICVENTKWDSGSAEIDVEDFHKAAAKVIAEGAEGGITHTKETDIHIDPTAVVLGKDVAKNLEIEFIDVGNLSVDGNGDNESGRDTDSTSDTNRTAIKTKIKKPEKRELKRLHLKSKFKRLGMLPVANFNDKNGDLDNNTDQMGN